MSTDPASQAPVPATLGDVLDVLQGRDDLQPWLRRDLCSAIRTLCRALGQVPADVPAEPDALRRRMKDLSAPALGISRGSWRNAKSLVSKALAVAGIAMVSGRAKRALMGEWKELLDQAPAPSRYQLSRLARYCSARGLGPAAVNDEIMTGFAQALLQGSLVSRPKQVHRSACIAWNDCVAGAPGWPQQLLSVSNNRQDYSLPWSDFPESFRADVNAYLDHLAGADLLEDAAANPASPATLRSRRTQLRQMASALVYSGRNPETIQGLADLVGVDTAKTILSFFLKRRGQRKTGQIHNFALLMINIARHWVKVPPDQLEQLQKLRRRVDPGERGLTDTTRTRLLQFEDEANIAQLIQLPELLAAEARRQDRGGITEALKVQTALALAILLACPIRVKNLAGLNLERHIRRSRPGGRKVHLVIPAHEVKNKADLEFELPSEVVAILDRYIEVYRPRLVRGPNPWLFPARSGGSKPPGPFGTQLKQAIKRATGLVVHVHLFRHLAAQLILQANPGAYELVRLLLGHKSAVTTTTYYCGSEQKAALKYYDSIVGKYRKREEDDDVRK
jgi:integrase